MKSINICILTVIIATLTACSVVDLHTGLSRTAPSTSIDATFVKVIGNRGTSPGEFHRPEGISVNRRGDVYVVDSGNERIQKLDAEGVYITEIGGFGWSAGQFNQPLGIDATSGLDVWITDTQNRRIARMNADLHWISSLTTHNVDGISRDLGEPTGVAVSADGWLWFTDRDEDRLRRLSPFSVGSETPSGSIGTGDLDNPSGIAIASDGTIYVADTGNDQIAVYDQFGSFLNSIGRGFLKKPRGVTVTPLGDICIADTDNHRIVFCNRLGHLVGSFGSAGTGPGQFTRPSGVAVDRSGRVWVSDTGNNRLQILQLQRKT
jgi:tripartite motif-containing protein 71